MESDGEIQVAISWLPGEMGNDFDQENCVGANSDTCDEVFHDSRASYDQFMMGRREIASLTCSCWKVSFSAIAWATSSPLDDLTNYIV